MSRKNFNSFIKRQKAEQKRKKKAEKFQKREERKEQPSADLDDMIVIQSLDGFEKTLNQLEKMDIDLLLTSHPYLPFRKASLHVKKAKELMQIQWK